MSLAEREIPMSWVATVVMVPFAVLVAAATMAAVAFMLNHINFEIVVVTMLIVLLLTKE